LIILNLTD